ncbi:MAG: hypothetical protein E7084_01685 [Bacteroidales bacterium]|nr:hypothetical protein [Bacteroidales bacterium]
MNNRIIYFFALLLGLQCMVACCDKCDEPPHDKPVMRHTALIYMMAENSLSDPLNFDTENINAMRRAIEDNTIDGRLLIFIDEYNRKPCLLEISKKNKSSVIDTLITYDNCLSTDTTTIRQVMDDVIKHAPADSYGLFIWTHASGWLPQNRFYAPSRQYATTSIGREGSKKLTIDVDNFAKALQPYHFDYILFDACLMSCVEVAYELRDVCDHIIATPTETMGAGFPYYEIVPLLYHEEINHKQICVEYYNKYISPASSSNTGGTIALIETKHLEELADICHNIVEGRDQEILDINLKDIQYYDNRPPHVLYDLAHYMQQLATPDEYIQLTETLNKVVPYKAASRRFLNITIDTYCGLSSYIPGSSNDSIVEEFYNNLQWSQRIYN